MSNVAHEKAEIMRQYFKQKDPQVYMGKHIEDDYISRILKQVPTPPNGNYKSKSQLEETLGLYKTPVQFPSYSNNVSYSGANDYSPRSSGYSSESNSYNQH